MYELSIWNLTLMLLMNLSTKRLDDRKAKTSLNLSELLANIFQMLCDTPVFWSVVLFRNMNWSCRGVFLFRGGNCWWECWKCLCWSSRPLPQFSCPRYSRNGETETEHYGNGVKIPHVLDIVVKLITCKMGSKCFFGGDVIRLKWLCLDTN